MGANHSHSDSNLRAAAGDDLGYRDSKGHHYHGKAGMASDYIVKPSKKGTSPQGKG